MADLVDRPPLGPGDGDGDHGVSVEAYVAPLGQLWAVVSSCLGEASAAAIFHSALREAASRYTFLRELRVTEDGFRLNGLTEQLPRMDRATARTGLICFLDGVTTLLRDLTGEVVLRRVQPLIQRFKEGPGGV